MKKTVSISVGILFVGLAIWYLAKGSNSRPQITPAQKPSQMTMKALGGQAIPKEELNIKKVVAQDDGSIQCGAQWERVSSADVRQLQEDLKRGVFQLVSTCRQFEDQDVGKKIYELCDYDSTRGSLKDEKTCLANILLYRILWLDRLTADQTDYRRMSLPLLANKIISRFQGMFQHPEMRAEVKQMINELIDRDPNFFEARKAMVAIEMSKFSSPEFSPQEMSKAIENAMKLNPEDSQVVEAYLFSEQMQGRSETAENFIEQHPESGLGYYYRAWVHWKAQDKAAALADLQQAARLLPEDARIAKTLEDVKQGRSENLFNVTVGFNLGDL